jgi:hypothetical protein
VMEEPIDHRQEADAGESGEQPAQDQQAKRPFGSTEEKPDKSVKVHVTFPEAKIVDYPQSSSQTSP